MVKLSLDFVKSQLRVRQIFWRREKDVNTVFRNLLPDSQVWSTVLSWWWSWWGWGWCVYVSIWVCVCVCVCVCVYSGREPNLDPYKPPNCEVVRNWKKEMRRRTCVRNALKEMFSGWCGLEMYSIAWRAVCTDVSHFRLQWNFEITHQRLY